jgi:hypothetical protein
MGGGDYLWELFRNFTIEYTWQNINKKRNKCPGYGGTEVELWKFLSSNEKGLKSVMGAFTNTETLRLPKLLKS